MPKIIILLRNVLKSVFITIQAKKTPFTAKKKFVILFLTLNGRGTAIASRDGKIENAPLTYYVIS